MSLQYSLEFRFVSSLGKECDGVRSDLVPLDLPPKVLHLALAALLLKKNPACLFDGS
jgi:hypothetical protein